MSASVRAFRAQTDEWRMEMVSASEDTKEPSAIAPTVYGQVQPPLRTHNRARVPQVCSPCCRSRASTAAWAMAAAQPRAAHVARAARVPPSQPRATFAAARRPHTRVRVPQVCSAHAAVHARGLQPGQGRAARPLASTRVYRPRSSRAAALSRRPRRPQPLTPTCVSPRSSRRKRLCMVSI